MEWNTIQQCLLSTNILSKINKLKLDQLKSKKLKVSKFANLNFFLDNWAFPSLPSKTLLQTLAWRFKGNK